MLAEGPDRAWRPNSVIGAPGENFSGACPCAAEGQPHHTARPGAQWRPSMCHGKGLLRDSGERCIATSGSNDLAWLLRACSRMRMVGHASRIRTPNPLSVEPTARL